MARILHLISSNQRRGAETFGTELAADMTERGHEVEVLAVAPSTSGPYLDVKVAGRHRADPVGLARILRSANANDLVVSFGSASLQSAGIAGALTRRPFIYRNIGDPTVWQSVRGARWRVGLPLRRASAIVAVFPEAGAEIARRYGIDQSRIRVIPRGVPSERFPLVSQERRSAARVELKLDLHRPWALLLGSLSEEKDPMLAVNAIAGHPSAGLIVVGDGPLAAAVRAQTVMAPNRLRMLGPVDDVRTPLAAADLLILTSRTEGVPGVAIEAGLSGLPVVASKVGGIPYLVSDRETGILVDYPDVRGFTNAVSAALASSAELGPAAASRCRAEFSMSAVGAAWHELVTQVLQDRDRLPNDRH